MKYWVYMNGEVPGCYTPQELGGLTDFSQTTLVCPAEGEILEKNWRRSGEFPDIITILHERQAAKAPLSPAPVQDSVQPADVNLLIDTASTRLFSHVADLMKELDTRREERALTQSVQRQLVDLKEQLTAARERGAMLETRLPRLAELEEAARKDQERLQSLEAALRAREDGLTELRMQGEKTRTELDSSKRRLGEALNDLAIRNRLVDKLSRDLTEKELSLAKALGVIRRLEEDLNRIMPGISGAPAPETIRAEPVAPMPAPVAAPPAPAAMAAPPPFMAPPPPPPVADALPPLPAPSALAALPPMPVLAPAFAAAPVAQAAAPSPVAEAVAPVAAAPAAEPAPDLPSYTTDEPAIPAPPPFAVSGDAPAAQNAIVDLFKRFLSKDLHS